MFNCSVDKSRIIEGLASKPRILSKGEASQFKGYTPHRDVNQLGNVCSWQRQCHDTILRTI